MRRAGRRDRAAAAGAPAVLTPQRRNRFTYGACHPPALLLLPAPLCAPTGAASSCAAVPCAAASSIGLDAALAGSLGLSACTALAASSPGMGACSVTKGAARELRTVCALGAALCGGVRKHHKPSSTFLDAHRLRIASPPFSLLSAVGTGHGSTRLRRRACSKRTDQARLTGSWGSLASFQEL